MELKSNLICKGKIWYELNKILVNDKQIFETFWQVFKISLAIGILYDKQEIDLENYEPDDKVELPRQMFNREISQMDMFFQSAILTSNCINFNEKDRLYLAFSANLSDDEVTKEEREELKKGVSQDAFEFNQIAFLKQFANYGSRKIYSLLSENDGELLSNFMEFFDDSYKGITPELVEMAKVESMEDDIF